MKHKKRQLPQALVNLGLCKEIERQKKLVHAANGRYGRAKQINAKLERKITTYESSMRLLEAGAKERETQLKLCRNDAKAVSDLLVQSRTREVEIFDQSRATIANQRFIIIFLALLSIVFLLAAIRG